MGSEAVHLVIRQQPNRGQAIQESNIRNRKPIDPPPIIELRYDTRMDPNNNNWLVSPRMFMMVTLVDAKGDTTISGRSLVGQTVSSLHRLKDINNKDGGFFVFGDITARKTGHYRLRFSMFDTHKDTEEVEFMGSIDSDIFAVLTHREFQSMKESTHLTRTFSDQGVKLRVRKGDPHSMTAGHKRGYNVSPCSASPVSMQPGPYGGAVQDHYGMSGDSPLKRQRTESEYERSRMFQELSSTNNGLGHYNMHSSMSGAMRSWSGDQQSRMHSTFGQQLPLGMSMMNRGGPAIMPSAQNWGSLSQQNTLPSPTTTTGSQQQSYQSVGSQNPGLSYGVNGVKSSTPRGSAYYGFGGYPTQSLAQTNDRQEAYPETLSSSASLANPTGTDGNGLISPESQEGFTQSYLNGNNLFNTESSEAQDAFPSFDEKF